MFTRLVDSLAATERLSEVFSDASVLQAMLDFETALARAAVRVGLIPEAAAEQIAAAANAADYDVAELVRLSLRAGTPAIPLVRMLSERSNGYAHWGATSQDVVDTALVLLLRKCRAILEADHARVTDALRRMSDEHASTIMLGRTLLQPAPPVTFGLKTAGWLASIRRGWSRVASRFDEAMYLQFGGASGTLAAFGDRGLAVSEALAEELALPLPDAPWHAHRDRLGALLAALSIYTASLGKMALDVALLMQYEVGEVSEPGGSGRGGSSTMPHKTNPTACMLTVAAARRTPGLLANFLCGMLQEHERAVGGWQAEWSAVEGIVQAAGIAVESMREVAEGLTVDEERMRRNLDETQGAIFAERAMLRWAPELGRAAAQKRAAELPADVQRPEDYLGTAEVFRTRLVKGDSLVMPFADSNGCRIYYRLEGSAAKPLLVLVHALGTDHGVWDPQMPALLQHFQVLRPDLRGHGASDAPAGEYSIEQLANDVLSVVPRDRFHFCGLSLGGMIGQWLGANAGHRIDRLVLANTSPRMADPGLFEVRRTTVLAQGMGAIAEAVMQRYFTRANGGNAEANSVRSVVLGTNPAGYAGCCAAIRDMDQRAASRLDKVTCSGDCGRHGMFRRPGKGTARFWSTRFREPRRCASMQHTFRTSTGRPGLLTLCSAFWFRRITRWRLGWRFAVPCWAMCMSIGR